MFALAWACGSAAAAPIHPEVGASQEGKATFYSDSLAGGPTASGETYDPEALTAAHRTLPFGTRVRVSRLDNGRSVEVRINDRGPFGRRDRIIDLSRAAAEALDMVRAGVVRVRLEVLEVP
ncbi:MAG: septal ring lytic transglycosylase RlpA family protein [Deltaproteobacteria bacterium]|nr:septal ring lytic transglycosylase RlpA family protein [Deltaproteobacteria bacterium]